MPAPAQRALTPRKRVAFLGLATLALVIVASFVQLHEWLVSFLPVTQEIIANRPLLGATVFIVFAAVSAMLAFVSSAVIVPIGVYAWGKLTTMLLLVTGWVLGGICAYAISRYFGRPAVKALIASSVLDRYEERISRRAPFGLVLLFQLALPSEVPSYVLGLVRYRFWKYVCALMLAELPYSAATVYLGESFVERRLGMMVGVGAVIVGFSAWALHMLNRRFRQQEPRDRHSRTA